MQGFLRDFKRQINNLLRPFPFPQPFSLIKEVEKVKKKFDVEPTTPAFCDFNQLLSKVYFLWNSRGEKGLTELTSKEKRCLPWILYIGGSIRTIDQIDLLKAILELFNPPKASYLNTLIHIYLKNFDLSKGNEILRQFVLNHLKIYDGINPRLKKWKSKINFLFTKNAVFNTANWILFQKNKHPNTCLEELGLTGDLSDSGFLRHVTLSCLKATEKSFGFLPTLLSLLESPTNSSVRFPEILPEVATSLIPKAEKINISREIRDLLCSFFIKHLGDPRLPGGRTRWKKVSEKAHKIFIQWLSKEDIRFFFEVVEKSAKDPNWRYRRKFWEAYLPHIEKTWVVLGTRARDLAKGTEYRFGKLLGASSDQSVFLVKMRGYVFIEWSHSGACRIYRESNFPWEFGSESYYASEIYWSDPEYKQIHRLPERYHWQDELAKWISLNLGIHPAKSYYLS